jgi:hypothetical protein
VRGLSRVALNIDIQVVALKRNEWIKLLGQGGREAKKSNIHAKKAGIDRQAKPLIAAYLKAMRHRRF